MSGFINPSGSTNDDGMDSYNEQHLVTMNPPRFINPDQPSHPYQPSNPYQSSNPLEEVIPEVLGTESESQLVPEADRMTLKDLAHIYCREEKLMRPSHILDFLRNRFFVNETMSEEAFERHFTLVRTTFLPPLEDENGQEIYIGIGLVTIMGLCDDSGLFGTILERSIANYGPSSDREFMGKFSVRQDLNFLHPSLRWRRRYICYLSPRPVEVEAKDAVFEVYWNYRTNPQSVTFEDPPSLCRLNCWGIAKKVHERTQKIVPHTAIPLLLFEQILLKTQHGKHKIDLGYWLGRQHGMKEAWDMMRNVDRLLTRDILLPFEGHYRTTPDEEGTQTTAWELMPGGVASGP